MNGVGLAEPNAVMCTAKCIDCARRCQRLRSAQTAQIRTLNTEVQCGQTLRCPCFLLQTVVVYYGCCVPSALKPPFAQGSSQSQLSWSLGARRYQVLRPTGPVKRTSAAAQTKPRLAVELGRDRAAGSDIGAFNDLILSDLGNKINDDSLIITCRTCPELCHRKN